MDKVYVVTCQSIDDFEVYIDTFIYKNKEDAYAKFEQMADAEERNLRSETTNISEYDDENAEYVIKRTENRLETRVPYNASEYSFEMWVEERELL